MADQTAAKYDITIEQGATFVRSFDFVAGITDLTGYTARMRAKSVNSGEEIFDLTVGNGLTMTATNLTATISDETTTDYNFGSGTYTLKITSPGGRTTRIAYGSVTLSRES